MIKKDHLIDAVLGGIIKANSFYEDISNGFWLNNSAVESVMQTKIAESIYDSLKKDDDGSVAEGYIVLEYYIRDIILESASNSKRGPIPKLAKGAKRVDILLYDSSGRPILPIEIKRSATADGFAEDAKRIIGILRRSDAYAGGSVKYGLICGFVFGRGDSERAALSNIKSQISKSEALVEEKLRNSHFKFRERIDDPKCYEEFWWVGGAVCVYLRRKSAA